MSTTYSMTEANRHTAEMVNAARYGHEPVMITDHGKVAAAVISAEMLARFQALEEAADQGLIDEINARGPQWIPAEDGIPMMEQILAEAEAAQDR
ncbi:type II toxin-antitoxin system Phd/YefM family antitoxin [Kribbella sp. NPDC004536]|uniref:type II toxin-antitoxin system Phd/YefM family antitoxin n=1 Tax=Kribbella sp. NPDC004536 TaxID=3364106 RepID=UPI00367ADF06